ncbi:MAG: hypothetical protein KJ958_01980 [Gammaproteobacteria bacterium]|nr:hypothetical protein [Gammaproteobacteria bacterium]MBU1977918.1 hypothetical protein [Gammaproteobacteria bacterium]
MVPPSYQVPVLAALTEQDDVAYLLADCQLNVLYLSDRISEFGVPSHGIGLPLTSVYPDLAENRGNYTPRNHGLFICAAITMSRRIEEEISWMKRYQQKIRLLQL